MLNIKYLFIQLNKQETQAKKPSKDMIVYEVKLIIDWKYERLAWHEHVSWAS